MAMSPLTVFGSQPYFSYTPSPVVTKIAEEESSLDHLDAAKAASQSVVKPIAIFKGASAAQPSYSASQSSFISVCDVTDQSAKTVYKTIKAWKEYVEDRVGHTRSVLSLFNEEHQGELDQAAEQQKISLQKKVAEDLKAKNEYREVIDRISTDVEAIAKKASKVMVRVLLDNKQNIQAMASYSLKDSCLYVNLLATAPSNLRLHGRNAETHQPFKGGGTIILHSLYATAQQKRLPRLVLSPLDGSFTFYQHIGMKVESIPEEKKEHFYFDVQEDRLPTEFEKQFNRLSLNLSNPDN
jgi:hypothetical protein